jgi:plastocyanin
MTRPAANWRVALKKGDKLVESATYETQRASWYESMGINVAYIAFGDHEGVNPFRRRVAQQGFATHGHLAENNNLGGQALPGSADPTKAPDGQTLAKGVAIAGFQYLPGNLGLPAPTGLPPVVHQGDQLRFGNFDAPEQIFHTITACAAPCNKSTGLAYPLADGPVDFDSGDLGHGPDGFTAAAQREDWYTPKNLAPGTYTYFCRIHPFMRGAFRVVPK